MKVYNDFDVEGCEVSEKYDGICGIWDGKQMLTRDGNVLDVPDWFVASLPDHELRGELWCGRGKFENALSICLAQNSDNRWKEVRYMVFDSPCNAPLGEFAQYVERAVLADKDELYDIFAAIVDAGGEGVVIRNAKGVDYKLKPIEDDDAVVIGHVAGKGRNAGRCGSLLVRDMEGREFKIGNCLNDELRENPPEIGVVVTFAYQGRTRTGKPKCLSDLRVRAEKTFV